jgi:hypothetical protein
MNTALAALAGLLLMGGPRHDQPPPSERPAVVAPFEVTVVFDEREGRELVGVRTMIPETTPPAAGWRLSERTAGSETRIAERVGDARYAPDGAILYVQEDALFERKGGETRLLTRPVVPDFALDPAGRRIAVVRRGESGTAIELLERDGTFDRELAPARGWNGLPLFTSDGEALVFLSSRTGVASFFRIDVNGERSTQLTNQTVRQAPEGFGPDFVPPANSRRGMRWVEGPILEFDAGGGELWHLDVSSGAARRIGGAR